MDSFEQFDDRLHVAQGPLSVGLRKPVELVQRPELAVPCRNRVQKPLRQTQGAEAADSNPADAEPFPLRQQHLVEVVLQVVGDERQLPSAARERLVDQLGRFAVTLENLAGIPAACITSDGMSTFRSSNR